MDAEQNKINPEYLLPGTMVGPWEIVDLLGKGGFGVAYKVRRDGRYYALKLTLFRAADLSPDQRDRHEASVRRECGILLQLNHPNIVRVHGFERWPDLNEGYLYIVMDLVNGQKLYAWRDRSVPSLRRICHVFQRIALALAEAHERGAFHRDIKSENVLVGIDGEPILIDWGIARDALPFPARVLQVHRLRLRRRGLCLDAAKRAALRRVPPLRSADWPLAVQSSGRGQHVRPEHYHPAAAANDAGDQVRYANAALARQRQGAGRARSNRDEAPGEEPDGSLCDRDRAGASPRSGSRRG